MEKFTNKKLLKFYFFSIITVWTAAVGLSLLFTIVSAEKHITSTAIAQSKMALEKDKMYRVWGSAMGGVYLPADKVQPNPYLSHVKDRDVTLTDGRVLTLVNPAYMVRLVFEFSKDRTPIKTHLISDQLLNPINAAKDWEIKALKKILSGDADYYEFAGDKDRPQFRYMVPFVTESTCLKCHAAQGYKEGDIRGAISIISDIKPIIDAERDVEHSAVIGYMTLWVFVVLLFALGYRSIYRMIDRIEASEKGIRAVNSRNESILSSAAEIIFGVDLRGYVTFINSSLTLNTGYEEDNIIGRSHIILTHKRNDMGHPLEDENCAIMQTLRDRITRKSVETFFRLDGTSFYGELFVSAIVENGTVTGAVISCFDITERLLQERELEKNLKEKSILLSELHHRVKNNLQIVSGILSLQADSAEDSHAADTLKNAQSRVMSMAIMHECLYKSPNITHVDMNLYFSYLIEHYKSVYTESGQSVTFVTDIDNLDLGTNRLSTCGILINEIITNSIKHAFESTENPEINISLKESGGNAVLSISDNGKGFNVSEAENSDSLGMMLIGSLTEQLYGSLEISSEKGTCIKITFPLSI